jgi:hypothetical protein
MVLQKRLLVEILVIDVSCLFIFGQLKFIGSGLKRPEVVAFCIEVLFVASEPVLDNRVSNFAL